MKIENIQEYKKKLDLFSSSVSKAYFDSVMFLSIVQLANDKDKTNNILFDYSYYSIRERTIIASKSLIEPAKKDKLTVESVIKELQQIEEYETFADGLHEKYKELLQSEEAKRVKDFRDSLCHNIENKAEMMIYCKDIMFIIGKVMDILDAIYIHIFKTVNNNFDQIRHISMILADDYWSAICEQADKMPDRHKELWELQKMFNC